MFTPTLIEAKAGAKTPEPELLQAIAGNNKPSLVYINQHIICSLLCSQT